MGRRVRKAVGSDIDESMLEAGYRNLIASGLDVEIFDRAVSPQIWEEELKRDRIVLVKDDIVHTALPPSYFDHVAIVFPHVIPPCYDTIGGCSNYDPKTIWGLVHHSCNRMLQGDGLFTAVHYDAGEKVKAYQAMLASGELPAENLTYLRFVHNPEVYGDLNRHVLNGNPRGFTITTLKKDRAHVLV